MLGGVITCSRGMNPQKSCYSNLRVVQGAVEMYNMDSKVMLEELNKETFKNLVIGGYIKEGIACPAGKINKYKGEHLAGDGEVYCGINGVGYRARDYFGNYDETHKDNCHGSLSGR